MARQYDIDRPVWLNPMCLPARVDAIDVAIVAARRRRRAVAPQRSTGLVLPNGRPVLR
jgi:hypothetical protein